MKIGDKEQQRKRLWVARHGRKSQPVTGNKKRLRNSYSLPSHGEEIPMENRFGILPLGGGRERVSSTKENRAPVALPLTNGHNNAPLLNENVQRNWKINSWT